MDCFAIHPNVYATGPHNGLLRILEQCWTHGGRPGDGTWYIISGFANFNGGVRFYSLFKEHVKRGGRVEVLFSARAGFALSSKQVVEELLGVGAIVTLVNRKRILHAKLYGRVSTTGQQLVVTSGNFTGPGMSQNVEASVLLGDTVLNSMNFTWASVWAGFLAQKWQLFQPSLADRSHPAWSLLYDERVSPPPLEDEEMRSMIIRLGHADTARIQAPPGSDAGKGTQYFWLSRDCFDFFPPLTIPNTRGHKQTWSCLIDVEYPDLKIAEQARVTFEAENNLDFRLGTGPLRYTRVAAPGDLAVISRIDETKYQIRLVKQKSKLFAALDPYANRFIGHSEKRYGYILNSELEKQLGHAL